MTASHPTGTANTSTNPAGLGWVLVPAIAMSLGWGLRGYIGGGPFGAMIPGVLVSLMICQFLNYRPSAAAVVVVFAAFGIGFGGEMTYGQTLGLMRKPDTFSWGLTGTTLKGAVWGLLGGAVLGTGFIARHLSRKHLTAAFACMLVAAIVGIAAINEPKLIYFSDPVNRPRDESWAGFVLGALAFLSALWCFRPDLAAIPARFALVAAIGGAIGFGGGSLFISLQSLGPEEWSWLPYWKFMEFTFGFLFGAALGLCTQSLRDRLMALEEPPPLAHNDSERNSWLMILLVAAAGALVVLIPVLIDLRPPAPLDTVLRVLLSFTGISVLLMLLGRESETAAWQAAVTIAIVMAAIDWQGDLAHRGPIELPGIYRALYVASTAVVSIAFIEYWRRQPRPRLMGLFLFAACVFMAMGYLMGVSRVEILWPQPEAVAAAGGLPAYYWERFAGEIIVHAIFTTLFLLSVVAALRKRRREVQTEQQTAASTPAFL